MTDEVDFDGVALPDLQIIDVVWSDRAAEHIRTRTARKGHYDPDIEPEWATEAATDPHALRAVSSKWAAVVVIGHSHSMPSAGAMPGRVLKVVLAPNDVGAGEWRGITAAVAARSSVNRYWTWRLAREQG